MAHAIPRVRAPYSFWQRKKTRPSARQQSFRQAEGEPVERQRVECGMVAGRRESAQVVKRGADGGFVQSFD